jgi:hypothetical protein
MKEREADKEKINPAARRDRPGEPRDDLVERDPPPPDRPPKSYQDGKLEPRDHGGVAE